MIGFFIALPGINLRVRGATLENSTTRTLVDLATQKGYLMLGLHGSF